MSQSGAEVSYTTTGDWFQMLVAESIRWRLVLLCLLYSEILIIISKNLKLVTNTFCLHLVQKNRNFTRVAWYIMKGVKGVSPELDRIRPSFSNVAEFRLHNRFRDLSQTALHLILSYKCCEMIINFDLKWLFKIILQISVKNTN